ncbi:hypothetical protein Tco_0897080 [Tanacetum coccineum]
MSTCSSDLISQELGLNPVPISQKPSLTDQLDVCGGGVIPLEQSSFVTNGMLLIKTPDLSPNLDPPAGLFVSHNIYPFKCDFVSLDSRIQSRKGTVENFFTLASTKAVENVKIVQSCNSLLLFHPLIYLKCFRHQITHMAFDPTKSLNYKVVHVGHTFSHIDIQTYYSETGNWKLCRDWFNFFSFDHFDSAIYWNGALHWLETKDIQDGYLKHYKLNIEDHDHPILTTIQIHQGLHRVRNFFEPLGNNLRVCITIQIPQTLHVEGKLFESRGCLLAVLRDYIGSREFTIYEMRKGCSVWSVRYLVNTDDFMNPLPEGWSIWSIVWSIVLGEREEDSCLVINLSGKVVEYNLISKTLHEIYDIGSNQLDDDELIPPFAADHNVYEFIPSFASV